MLFLLSYLVNHLGTHQIYFVSPYGGPELELGTTGV